MVLLNDIFHIDLNHKIILYHQIIFQSIFEKKLNIKYLEEKKENQELG